MQELQAFQKTAEGVLHFGPLRDPRYLDIHNVEGDKNIYKRQIGVYFPFSRTYFRCAVDVCWKTSHTTIG